MKTEDRMSFIRALQELDAPALLGSLPQVSVPDLKAVCQDWLSGRLGTIDPTNVLGGGDCADQFLNLPEHAAVMYDAALEYLDKHRDSIADDTDCAAASLNLMDLLAKSGQAQAALAAATRAARLPVKRAEQNIQIAFALARGGDAKTAYMLFQRGKTAGLSSVAGAMGVPVEDLSQMERVLARAAGVSRW